MKEQVNYFKMQFKSTSNEKCFTDTHNILEILKEMCLIIIDWADLLRNTVWRDSWSASNELQLINGIYSRKPMLFKEVSELMKSLEIHEENRIG